jgi:hypothetical protein
MRSFNTEKPRLLIENRERDAVMAVADGSREAVILIYNIREICRTSQSLDFLQILFWLKKNGKTGRSFIDFIMVDHERAIVKAVADIRRQIHKDHKLRAVIARGF